MFVSGFERSNEARIEVLEMCYSRSPMDLQLGLLSWHQYCRNNHAASSRSYCSCWLFCNPPASRCPLSGMSLSTECQLRDVMGRRGRGKPHVTMTLRPRRFTCRGTFSPCQNAVSASRPPYARRGANQRLHLLERPFVSYPMLFLNTWNPSWCS